MQKKMILKSDMRVYFDMDGTIAKWRDVPMEESRKPGYYTDLEPETELLDFLSAALKADKNRNILSSYYTDTRALLKRKSGWISTCRESALHTVSLFLMEKIKRNLLKPCCTENWERWTSWSMTIHRTLHAGKRPEVQA